MSQKQVACKSCGRKFLVPVVDTNRQEITPSDMADDVSFALICPFCMSHTLYTSADLE